MSPRRDRTPESVDDAHSCARDRPGTSSAKLRILFITTALNYPNFRQRLETFRQLGADVVALGFNQSFPYPVVVPDDEPGGANATKRLGVINPRQYARRLMQLGKLVPVVRASVASADVVFAVGFDAAVLARTASLGIKHDVIAYEIHDIRQAMLRRDHVGWAMRLIERWVMRRVRLLIVTAEGYLTHYYRDVLHSTVEAVVLENKIWPGGGSDQVGLSESSPPLRIGYFGSLRCTRAWQALTGIASGSDGAVEVNIRGTPSGLASFYRDIETTRGMTYGGGYTDPDDLEEIHRGIHLVWAAGFHGKDSYAWARSRRFYAACRYQRPIIAQVDTDEGALVERLGIGLCVDIRDIEATISAVRRISNDQLTTWRENLSHLPAEVYAYSNEHRRLLDRLAELATV